MRRPSGAAAARARYLAVLPLELGDGQPGVLAVGVGEHLAGGYRAAVGTVPAPPLLLGPHDPEHFGVRAACGRLPQQCRGPPARRACALS